jgi:hypothetical protein|nr:hypothetical protein [uncultured Prevotella sp.]
MTFEEAKKILKKEGFHMCLAPMVINQTGAIREFEKPEVCEAIKVANANKWTIGLSPVEWDDREARLKKEYGKNHIKHGDPIPCSPALKEAASQFNDALLDEQGKKIKRFDKEIARLNKIIRKKNLKIAEKDEVIGDLGKELKAMKQQLDSYTKMAQKMAEVIVHKKPVTVDFFEMCWELAYSEEKKATEELSKVLNDVIDRFLLFGEIIIKEE